jgi:hypothetical protein
MAGEDMSDEKGKGRRLGLKKGMRECEAAK